MQLNAAQHPHSSPQVRKRQRSCCRLAVEEPCGTFCRAQGALNKLAEFSILPVAYAAPDDSAQANIEAAAKQAQDAVPDPVKDSAKQAANSAKGAAESAKETIKQAAKQAQDAVPDSVKDFAKEAAGSVKGAAESAKETVKAAAKQAQDAAAPDPERDSAKQAAEEALRAAGLNDMVKEAVLDFQKRQKAKLAKEAEAAAPPSDATVSGMAKDYYDRAYAMVQDAMQRIMKPEDKKPEKEL